MSPSEAGAWVSIMWWWRSIWRRRRRALCVSPPPHPWRGRPDPAANCQRPDGRGTDGLHWTDGALSVGGAPRLFSGPPRRRRVTVTAGRAGTPTPPAWAGRGAGVGLLSGIVWTLLHSAPRLGVLLPSRGPQAGHWAWVRPSANMLLEPGHAWVSPGANMLPGSGLTQAWVKPGSGLVPTRSGPDQLLASRCPSLTGLSADRGETHVALVSPSKRSSASFAPGYPELQAEALIAPDTRVTMVSS